MSKKNFRGETNYYGHKRIKKIRDEQKKVIIKICLCIQNGGVDIQKWANLSTFWKILALGLTPPCPLLLDNDTGHPYPVLRTSFMD